MYTCISHLCENLPEESRALMEDVDDESWLDPSISNGLFHPSNYSVSKRQVLRQCGGVLIAIR